MNLFIKKYWHYLLALLFALAVLFGLVQRQSDPYLTSGTKTYRFQKTPASDKTLNQYYQETQVLGKNLSAPHRISFVAVGDIMLSRNVAQKIKEAGDPAAPFRNMSAILQSADFSFGNLETPIVNGSGIIGGHAMVFAAPSSSLAGLIENKFKILNLANNHALDQNLAGINSTLALLDEKQLQHIGVGRDQTAAWQPAKIEQDGITSCFLGTSYASYNDNGKTKNEFVARMEDTDKLKAQILGLKPECDFVVVSMHAGTEYTTAPNQAQTNFAHTAIEAGADMVIGAHPHWVQTIEKYQGRYIFYSLGNFVFDQMWSPETREGLALKISLSRPATEEISLQGQKTPVHLDSVELLPVVIDDYSTPRPASETESKKILKKIGQESTLLY